MLTTNFSTIEWKNGVIENPTYFIASNLNAINKSTKEALDELEKELTGENPLYSVLSVYKSLNLFPDANNNNAINPKGRLEGSLVGVNSVGIGINNTASGDNSIAMGASSLASASGSIAIGDKSVASGVGTICIGTSAESVGDYSINIGCTLADIEKQPSGAASIAIGKNAFAVADNSVQIGEGINSLENSLQIQEQNIFHSVKTTDEDNNIINITNNFGNTPSNIVVNKFLGSAITASTSLGEGENIRMIADVFETNSPVVKNTTNALNGIPNNKFSPTSYNQFYYDSYTNKLRTNLTQVPDGDKDEYIERALLIFENTSLAQYNTINQQKLYIAGANDDNAYHIHSGDLIKIIVQENSTNSELSGLEKEIFLKIGALSEGYNFKTSYNHYYFDPIEERMVFKECRLTFDGTGFYFNAGGIVNCNKIGFGSLSSITVSDDYPIIKRIYKLF
ncbi:MAG: hypothetical protein J6J36_00885 [Clostridia bacterium]|nr:hypothetical protein [Clostridia bacterium]